MMETVHPSRSSSPSACIGDPSLNVITDNLDIWSSAEKPKKAGGRGRGAKTKKSPHGIQKLRELILELAVRGKLVPQDSNDEPASKLLENISIEKARLIKKCKIKKQKLLPPIGENEIQFILPEGWKWVRLGNVGVTQTGSTPKKVDVHHYGKFLPFIKPGDILDGQISSYTNDGLSEEGAKSLDRVATSGSVLMVCIGTIGKCAKVDRPVSFNQQINSITPFIEIGNYIEKTIQASNFQKRAWDDSSSTTISILNKGKWEQILIPLAPLAEQQRIVAKVDELMALCDVLEQEQTDSSEAHKILVETLLGTLTQTKDHNGLTATDDVQDEQVSRKAGMPRTTAGNAENAAAQPGQTAWQRIAEHFDTLFTTEHSIDQLKQTILQLAVMGKLVPQVPTDEPASKLLKKIATEKERLIKEKKIKKLKSLLDVSEEEKVFELPNSWEWVRFGKLVNFKSELVKSTDYLELDQVAPDSIEKGTGKLLFRRSVNESGVRGPNNKFYEGQILYSKIRPSLSKAIIAPFDGLCSADMYPLESMISSHFLLKEILSEVFLEQVRVAENRIKMPKLNIESLSNILIPLPPEAEQHRIVTKIDELMTICDSLKERVNEAQTTQVQLADAIVEQAVG